LGAQQSLVAVQAPPAARHIGAGMPQTLLVAPVQTRPLQQLASAVHVAPMAPHVAPAAHTRLVHDSPPQQLLSLAQAAPATPH
jgi:hypothetical protein